MIQVGLGEICPRCYGRDPACCLCGDCPGCREIAERVDAVMMETWERKELVKR